MTGSVVAVIVTYNSAAVVTGLLDSLPAALDGVEAHVVVVDNGSDDETVRRVEEWPGPLPVSVVRSTNRGYSAGINLGASQQPTADAIFVLNPDVRLRPGVAATMERALREPGVGIVAPQLLDPAGRRVDSLRRAPSLGRASGLGFTKHPLFSEYITADEAYRRRRVVDWATGAALLVSRQCHEALGGWDESYFLYSEETDFCLRASDAGWATLFEPDAVVEHIGGASGRNDRTHAMQILNRVRLYRRRHGRVPSCCYYGLTVASEVSWALRGHREARESVRSLLHPGRRPAELGLSGSVLPD